MKGEKRYYWGLPGRGIGYRLTCSGGVACAMWVRRVGPSMRVYTRCNAWQAALRISALRSPTSTPTRPTHSLQHHGGVDEGVLMTGCAQLGLHDYLLTLCQGKQVVSSCCCCCCLQRLSTCMCCQHNCSFCCHRWRNCKTAEHRDCTTSGWMWYLVEQQACHSHCAASR